MQSAPVLAHLAHFYSVEDVWKFFHPSQYKRAMQGEAIALPALLSFLVYVDDSFRTVDVQGQLHLVSPARPLENSSGQRISLTPEDKRGCYVAFVSDQEVIPVPGQEDQVEYTDLELAVVPADPYDAPFDRCQRAVLMAHVWVNQWMYSGNLTDYLEPRVARCYAYFWHYQRVLREGIRLSFREFLDCQLPTPGFQEAMEVYEKLQEVKLLPSLFDLR